MALLSHTIEYIADVSKLTKAVAFARKQFGGAGAGLDRMAKTSDAIADSLKAAATDAYKVQRLGKGAGKAPAMTREQKWQKAEEDKAAKAKWREANGFGPKPKAPSGRGGSGISGAAVGFAAGATTALIAGAARAGAAFADAVGGVLENADKASNSRIFDPEAYQRLSAAAQKSDTDIGAVEAASSKLRTELGKAKLNPELQRGLKALGVSSKEIKALSPEKQLGLISDRLRDFQDEGTRAIVAEKVFGTGEARAILPLLDQGSAKIAAYGDEAARLGMIMDETALDAAGATKDALEALGDRVNGLKTRIIGALMPSILDAADGLVETFDRMSGPIIEVAGTVVSLLEPALNSMIEIFSAVGEVVADAIGPLAEFWGPLLTVVFEGLETIVYQLLDIFYDLAEAMGLTGEDSTLLADAGDFLAETLGWLFEQASLVFDILGEIAGIVIEVASLIWDLIVGIEEATGVFSFLADIITGTVGGALEWLLGILEDVSELFDLFGSGQWLEGFKKLGSGILDFILAPLRMLVGDIIWLADTLGGEDLVPDSVRNFAENAKEGAEAFDEQDAAAAEKKSKRAQREEDRNARKAAAETKKAERAAAQEEAKRVKAAEKVAAGETKVSKARMSALEGEGRKLSGPGLQSLGARDEKGRDISIWLGSRLDTGKVAAAANRLGVAAPTSGAVPLGAVVQAMTPAIKAASAEPVSPLTVPGFALRPLSSMASPAAAGARAPAAVSIGTIEIHTSGSTPAENLRDFAEQIREVTRDEISRQVSDHMPSVNPGGLAG